MLVHFFMLRSSCRIMTTNNTYIVLPGLPKTPQISHGSSTRDYDWTAFLNPVNNKILSEILEENGSDISFVGIQREEDQRFLQKKSNSKIGLNSFDAETAFLVKNTIPVPVPESVYSLTAAYFKQVQWQDRHQTPGTYERTEEWLQATAAAFETCRLLIEAIRQDLEKKNILDSDHRVNFMVTDHFGVICHYWINKLLRKKGYKIASLHNEQIMPGYFQFSSAMQAWQTENNIQFNPRFFEAYLLRSADAHTCLSPEHALDAIEMTRLGAEETQQTWTKTPTFNFSSFLKQQIPLYQEFPPQQVSWNGCETVYTHIPAGIDFEEWHEYRNNPDVLRQAKWFKNDLAAKGWENKVILITFGRLDTCKHIPDLKWQYLKAMVHAWRNYGSLLHQRLAIIEKNSAPSLELKSGRDLYAANSNVNEVIEAVATYLESQKAKRTDSFVEIVTAASKAPPSNSGEKAIISLGDEKWSHAKLAAFALSLEGRSIFTVAGREGFNLTVLQAIAVTEGKMGFMAHDPGVMHYLDEKVISIRYENLDPEAKILADAGLIHQALPQFARQSSKTIDDLSLLASLTGNEFYQRLAEGIIPRGLVYDKQDANNLVRRAARSGKALYDLAKSWDGHKWWAANVHLVLNIQPSAYTDYPQELEAFVQIIRSYLPRVCRDDLAAWGLSEQDPWMIPFIIPESRFRTAEVE